MIDAMLEVFAVLTGNAQRAMLIFIDFPLDCITGPIPVCEAVGQAGPLPSDVADEHRAELVPSVVHRLVVDFDTESCQQVPDVPVAL